jgi:hypothetical protein
VRAGVDTCIWACGLLFLGVWGFYDRHPNSDEQLGLGHKYI